MDNQFNQLCRICISNFDSQTTTMIPIFGEDLLWEKITTLADVKIEKGDTLPQQVCIVCAKAAITACLFKQKCENTDRFFRHQLNIKKFEYKSEVITISEEEGESDNDNDDDDDDDDNDADDGPENASMDDGDDDGRPPYPPDKTNGGFDINSIRLMNEFMQQQQQHYHMIKNPSNFQSMNNCSNNNNEMQLDDEQLPLIPEIELITPQGEVNTNTTAITSGICDGEMLDYQCNICYQNFEMRQLLKIHMQNVHGTSGPVYECPNCRKTYFYKRFLEKHIRRGRCVQKRRNHTRPMQCTDCHVLFPTGHHLGWHKRTGCPSRASKVPLQQLFKQNIVHYNNFPKKITTKKPDNAFYAHNRKIFMSSTKRKGRTRIKLDAKKIALAKQLILKEATTTQIATELNISRTFAWRLRKNLVNGISIHERVLDQGTEDQQKLTTIAAAAAATATIKSDQIEKEKHEDEEEDDADDDDEEQEQTNNKTNHNNEEDENSQSDNNNSSITNRSIHSYSDKNVVLNQHNPLQISKNVHGTDMRFSGDGSSDDGDYKNYEASRQDCAQSIPFINQSISTSQTFCPPASEMLCNQLPVNLSIKSIASLQNAEVNESQLKKPRKPNVFIDEEKYEMAKGLVSQNASTMEIARQLNVSQMTAWKLRDAIVKGVPLSYRSKRESRPKIAVEFEEQQQQQQQQQQLPPTTFTPRPIVQRRRLKAAERIMRDKEITKEILEMIKEDSNIQYWKVSARLAEKGFPISPSSVCQKLKALGIHRRWKPGDKPPMLDMENLKMAGIVPTTSDDNEQFGLSNDQQQFEMAGAHFLSAFTR